MLLLSTSIIAHKAALDDEDLTEQIQAENKLQEEELLIPTQAYDNFVPANPGFEYCMNTQINRINRL